MWKSLWTRVQAFADTHSQLLWHITPVIVLGIALGFLPLWVTSALLAIVFLLVWNQLEAESKHINLASLATGFFIAATAGLMAWSIMNPRTGPTVGIIVGLSIGGPIFLIPVLQSLIDRIPPVHASVAEFLGVLLKLEYGAGIAWHGFGVYKEELHGKGTEHRKEFISLSRDPLDGGELDNIQAIAPDKVLMKGNIAVVYHVDCVFRYAKVRHHEVILRKAAVAAMRSGIESTDIGRDAAETALYRQRLVEHVTEVLNHGYTDEHGVHVDGVAHKIGVHIEAISLEGFLPPEVITNASAKAAAATFTNEELKKNATGYRKRAKGLGQPTMEKAYDTMAIFEGKVQKKVFQFEDSAELAQHLATAILGFFAKKAK